MSGGTFVVLANRALPDTPQVIFQSFVRAFHGAISLEQRPGDLVSDKENGRIHQQVTPPGTIQ